MNIDYPERIQLAELPTPIQELPRLSKEYGIKLFAKRDDMTGLELSGNKVRKLEFLLAEGLKQGADTVVTCGGIQSNHCRATAAAAVRVGLQCHLVLRTEPPQPPYDGNLLLDHLFGAGITYLPLPEFKKAQAEDFPEVLDELKARGRNPFYFPVGGSVPTGCWGYVKAFEETVKQLDEMGIKNARFISAIGSGGTHTGLYLGSLLMERPEFKITGFNVCDTADYFKTFNASLLNETVERFDLDVPPVSADEFEINGDYLGPGYAQPYPALMETIFKVARTEALLLDPVYTGKAFHGLLNEILKGSISKDETIIFFHTGGLFGLFPQKDQFQF